MDEFEDIWKHVVKWVVIFLTACVTSCTGDDIVKYALYANALNEATHAGRDPMTVGCAFGFSQTGEAAVCAANLQKQQGAH